MRFSRKTKYGLLGLTLMAWMACEDPQSLNNSSVVKNPFILRTDTLSKINSLTEMRDTLVWTSVPRLFLGSLPGYKTGIYFKIVLDSNLVDSASFDSVYLRFDRDLLFQNDPYAIGYPGSANISLYDARNVTPNAETGEWGNVLSTSAINFGVNDTTLIVYVNPDTILSVIQYDSAKTMTFALTSDGNDFIQRFYAYETAFPPKMYFHYPSLDTTLTRYVGYDKSVVSWNPGELDTTNFKYVSVLGSQKLRVSLNTDSLLIDPEETLQHVILANAILSADSSASKIYRQTKTDTIPPALAITLRQIIADTCNCNSASFNFHNADIGSRSFDITNVMYESVSVPEDSTIFFIRPLNAGMNPGYLAIPKDQSTDPVLKLVIHSARVVTP